MMMLVMVLMLMRMILMLIMIVPESQKARWQVGIADQIAIRSYVLGKGLKSSE